MQTLTQTLASPKKTKLNKSHLSSQHQMNSLCLLLKSQHQSVPLLLALLSFQSQTSQNLQNRSYLSVRKALKILAISAGLAFKLAPTPAVAIVNGIDDYSSSASVLRQKNATVYVNGCTGTLIAPQVVMTAGHCGVDPDYSSAGQWTRSTQKVLIKVGPDKNRPQFQARAAFVNYSGSLDMVLLGLEKPVPSSVATPIKALTTEVSSSATRRPDTFWRNQRFRIAGWGDTDPSSRHQSPNIRKTAFITYQSLPCDNLKTVMCGLGTRTVNGVKSGIGSGDSGGPVYWTDTRGKTWVIGVVQQPRRRNGGEGARFTYTFNTRGELKQHADHGDVPLGVSPATWLKRAMSENPAQAHARYSRQWPNWNLSQMRRAFSWFSPTRSDNFLTTDSRWSAPTRGNDSVRTWNKWNNTGQFRSYLFKSGYRLFRAEGLMFDPKKPQPAGTVPVFSWWSADRKDNFATTKPSWSMPVDRIRWRGEHIANGPKRGSYTLYRLEGFIYDPSRPQPPGTIPVYSWWSGNRTDNFMTTQMSWRYTTLFSRYGSWAVPGLRNSGEELRSGRTKTVGSSRYRLFRLEGYMPVTKKPN